jgi:hypothetical protein
VGVLAVFSEGVVIFIAVAILITTSGPIRHMILGVIVLLPIIDIVD